MDKKAGEEFRKEKELQELKGKVEEFGKELKYLSDEELDQVAGGRQPAHSCVGSCEYERLSNKCKCQND